jgi:hypothetical protein
MSAEGLRLLGVAGNCISRKKKRSWDRSSERGNFVKGNVRGAMLGAASHREADEKKISLRGLTSHVGASLFVAIGSISHSKGYLWKISNGWNGKVSTTVLRR